MQDPLWIGIEQELRRAGPQGQASAIGRHDMEACWEGDSWELRLLREEELLDPEHLELLVTKLLLPALKRGWSNPEHQWEKRATERGA